MWVVLLIIVLVVIGRTKANEAGVAAQVKWERDTRKKPL